jgi:hypothetical protein
VQQAVGQAGFMLWYPAESTVTPGQIWRDKRSTFGKLFRYKPDYFVEPSPPTLRTTNSDASFTSTRTTKMVDFNFTASALPDAGIPLARADVRLKAGTVKSYAIEFGSPVIERAALSTFSNPREVATFPESYRRYLRRITNASSDHALILAVLKTKGLRYRFECENTAKLAAEAKGIGQLIGANFSLDILSKTEAVWNVPNSKPMVIGAQLVTGDYLELPEEQAIELVAKALQQQQKQNLAAATAKAKAAAAKAKKK